MRTEGTLERDIILGKVEGHRRQGRPRLRWIDSIKEATGLSLEVLKESVKDRKKWRTTTTTTGEIALIAFSFHIPNHTITNKCWMVLYFSITHRRD
jgi:hypothetical protein